MIFNPSDPPVGVAGLDYAEWTYPASRVTVRFPLRTVGISQPRHTLSPEDLRYIRAGVANVWRETLITTPVIGSLEAQHAAVHGWDEGVDDFAQAIGIQARTAEWREAVSTALIGDWAHLVTNGGDPLIVPRHLKLEAERVHQQLQPLWERKVNGQRVQLLDAPIADGMTLRDLVSDHSSTDQGLLDQGVEDPRLFAVLSALDPDEREVAMAWGQPGVREWTDAAQYAGAAHPEAFGDRVRRKISRIVDRNAKRAASAAQTRASKTSTRG